MDFGNCGTTGPILTLTGPAVPPYCQPLRKEAFMQLSTTKRPRLLLSTQSACCKHINKHCQLSS